MEEVCKKAKGISDKLLWVKYDLKYSNIERAKKILEEVRSDLNTELESIRDDILQLEAELLLVNNNRVKKVCEEFKKIRERVFIMLYGE